MDISSYEKLTSSQKIILKCIAFGDRSFIGSINGFYDRYGLELKIEKTALEKELSVLVKMGFLYSEQNSYGINERMMQIFLFTQISDEEYSRLVKINPWSWNRTMIEYVKRKMQGNKPMKEKKIDSYLEDLSLSVLGNAELVSYFYPLFNTYYANVINMYFSKVLSFNVERDRSMYEPFGKLPDSSLRSLIEEFEMVQECVYGGRVKEIPNVVQGNSWVGMCMLAFYSQVMGDYKIAFDRYAKALKMRGKKYFGIVFFDFTYAWTLYWLREEPKIGVVISKLLSSEIYESEIIYSPVIFVLRKASGMMDVNQTILLPNYENKFSLSSFLCAWLSFHFDLKKNGYKVESEEIKDMPAFKCKYFQFELSTDFPQWINPEVVKDACFEGVRHLMGERIESWQEVLSVLLSGNKEGGLSKNAQRIIYILDEKLKYVTMKLQKRLMKGGWSTGQQKTANFLLSLGTDLEDEDREFLGSSVFRSYEWNPYCTYPLSGSDSVLSAMPALVGCDRIFFQSNMNSPLELKSEEAYLMVTEGKKGYSVSSNYDIKKGGLVQIYKDGNFCLNIVTTTQKKAQIISTLMNVKRFPLMSKPQLTQLLEQLSHGMTIHTDLMGEETDLSVKKMDGDSSICVQIVPNGSDFRIDLYVKPLGNEPPYCTPGVGSKSIMGSMNGGNYMAVRNLKQESDNVDRINSLLQRITDEDVENSFMLGGIEPCLDFLDGLRDYENITHLEWPQGVKLKISGRVDLPDFQLKATHGKNNWFDMEGGLKLSDESLISIAELLASMDGGHRFVRLNNDEYVSLSEQLRKQVQLLSAISYQTKGNVRVSDFSISGLDQIKSGGVDLAVDDSFTKLLARVKKAEKKKYELPEGLDCEMRDYQADGFRWMSRLLDWGAGACLADDMGLGKTIQAIAMLLDNAKHGASIVIAPASVLLNWKGEVEKFAPQLMVKVFNQAGSEREKLVKEAGKFDVLLATYGMLVTEGDLLQSKEWNLIVLDEAHTIKNKDTKMSQSAMLLKGRFRLLLTGTPVQNYLGELWNLFQFMNPGLLGTFEEFNQKYIIPIETLGDKIRQKQLKRLVSPFLLRRTKNEVLDELPQKTEVNFPVEMTEEEMSFYEALRRKAESSMMEGELTALQTLSEITKLRQAACHINLAGGHLKGYSSKIVRFLQILEVLKENGHRALVFSQFTGHLDYVRKALEEQKIDYLYLDGSTPIAERQKLVKKFQTGSQLVFLISLKAGGLGLNLTAADYVIHLDPWWNPAIEDQASDRAYRMGQTRPVTVYHLLAAQTIEEKIIRMHKTKKDLADSLLEGSNMSHKLSRDELLELLKEE